MNQSLKGSIVALITPMSDDHSIDFLSLEKLIEWHIKQGTNAIVSVGTTGESSTLTVEEHLKVIDFTVHKANGRIPVIAGSGSNSTSQAIETTTEAKNIGADYSLLVSPYYNKPSQKGLIAHYTKIADSCDLPQILYNVPSRTSCDILPQTVKFLSDHENIIGIKEAVSDKNRIDDLITISKNSKKDFLIFSGDDHTFFDLIAAGGHGVISVAANILPKDISNICKNLEIGNFEKAKKINSKLSSIYDLLFIESNPVPVKWMLHKMNFIEDAIRMPLISIDEKYRETISREMLKLNLL
tara:strand:+ start:76310 stop:77203 length:894 start_codon:yes stop_codon:yes gene_type:complete